MGDRDESYWSNFNSIKVRLKLLATLLGAGLGLLFQFHKGTIKTSIVITFTVIWISYFNSIKVRLKLV